MKTVDVYDTIPQGWQLIKELPPVSGGKRWICNGAPLFSKSYKHALLNPNK